MNQVLTIAARLTPLAGLTAQWRKRSPRERVLVTLMGVFLLAVLLYFVGYQPAQVQRQALQSELPILRREVAEMTMLMQQQSNKSPTVVSALDANGLKQALPALLARAQLDPAQIELTVLDPSHLRVVIPRADYALTMNALAEITHSQGLRLSHLSVTPVQPFSAGQASISLDWQLATK